MYVKGKNNYNNDKVLILFALSGKDLLNFTIIKVIFLTLCNNCSV